MARGVRARADAASCCARLGDPQRGFRAIHVVGTNGKTTTARSAEALLLAEGLRAGAYTSPHVVSWAERIRVGGEEADLEAALARVRARRRGGRRDAVRGADRRRARRVRRRRRSTSRSSRPASAAGTTRRTCCARPVVVLTNVALEHTDVLGADARGDRGREARRRPARARSSSSASPSGTRPRARQGPAASRWSPARAPRSRTPPSSRSSAARSTRRRSRTCSVPGRLERVGESPLEIWDGAHNLAGVGYLLARVPARGLGRRRLDPRRQGRRRDAGGALGARRSARRDHVVEPARAPGGRARRRSRGGSSRTSRTSPSPLEALARGRELAGRRRRRCSSPDPSTCSRTWPPSGQSCLPWQASASG